MNIIFVCTGNICRSAFAEHLARKLFPEHTYSSMGTQGLENVEAPETAIEVAKDFEVDLTPHRSQKIDRDQASRADYIFIMDKSHQFFFETYLPQIIEDVHLLASFGKKKGFFSSGKEVKDPYQKNGKFFKKVFKEIEEHLKRVIPEL